MTTTETSPANGMPVDIDDASAAPKAVLLPGILGLALFNLAVFAVSSHASLRLVGGLIVYGYLGVVILRARDVVSRPDRLHPRDRALTRVGGVLVVGVTATLIWLWQLLGTDWLIAAHAESATGPGKASLQFVLEVAIMLSTASLAATRRLDHIPPATLWRICCAYLLPVHSTALLISILGPLFGY